MRKTGTVGAASATLANSPTLDLPALPAEVVARFPSFDKWYLEFRTALNRRDEAQPQQGGGTDTDAIAALAALSARVDEVEKLLAKLTPPA